MRNQRRRDDSRRTEVGQAERADIDTYANLALIDGEQQVRRPLDIQCPDGQCGPRRTIDKRKGS